MAITYSGTIDVAGGYDSGTATTGTATTLTDTSKAWSTNLYVRRIVVITSGTGAGASTAVLSNTSNTLTVEHFTKFNYTTQEYETVTPDNTSGYAIAYDQFDLVTQQPTYCSYDGATTRSVVSTKTIVIKNGGYFGMVGAGLRLASSGGTDHSLNTEAGSYFQSGYLNLAFRGIEGGVIEFEKVQTSYNNMTALGTFLLYGSRVVVHKNFADSVNAEHRWNNGVSSENQQFVDTKITRMTVPLTGSAVVLKRGVCELNRYNLYFDNATSVVDNAVLTNGNVAFGNPTQPKGFDLFNLKFYGNANVGAFFRPLGAFLTTTDGVVYCHSPDFGDYSLSDCVDWYAASGPRDGTVYITIPVKLTVKDSSTLSLLENVAIAVTQASDNSAKIITGKNGVGDYSPILSRVVQSDANGTYVSPIGVDQGVIVLRAKLTYSGSALVSTVVDYNSYTLTILQYGYRPISVPRDWVIKEQNAETLFLQADAQTVLTASEARALSANFTVNGTTKVLTLSNAAMTASNTYDYTRVWRYDEAVNNDNVYTAPLDTVDGVNFTLGDGWVLALDNPVSGGINLTGDVNLNAKFDFSGHNITGALDFSVAGTYVIDDSIISEVTNSSGGAVIINTTGGLTVTTNTGPNITINTPVDIFTIDPSVDITGSIRYFRPTISEQTPANSGTGDTLAYTYADTDPIDIEVVEQGYVPVNQQNVTPINGTLTIEMDLDEAYNASHSLTIVTHYTYDRGTLNFNFLADQNAFDVRSSMADTIRTNSSYYNTPLLLEAKPGGKRIDLIDGATITSMATWKGAGMERYDAADAINPLEKWYAVQSVNDITGATVIYRQTNSGDFTVGSLTNNVFDETLQFYSDPDHDGTPATENNSYFLVKALKLTFREGRNDVVSGNGGANLKADLYTIGLAPTAHDYSGTDPGISADLTMTAGPYTVGGKTITYKWVDAGTNSGTDIADQIHYNRVTNPNGLIPGGTGLRWAEMPDMIIYVTGGVETAQGYREGATPTLVGFYMERGGADHPDMVRAQADDGTYYTPAVTANITITNLPDDVGGNTRLQIYNVTTATEYYSDDPAGTGYSASYTDGVGISAGDSIRIRFAHLNGATSFESGQTFATASTSGFSVDGSTFITANSVYADNAIDGSSITKFTADFVNDELDVSSAANFTGPETWAFFCMTLTTANGISQWWGGYEAIDIGNYRNNSSVVSMYFDETFGSTKRQTDSSRIFRSDGVYPVKDPTTTGYGVDINWQVPVYVKEVNTGSAVNKATVIDALTDQGYTSTRAPKLDTIPDDVWQSPKAIPKLLSVE